MILSAAALLREYGASATSVDRVLAHSGAPRGSVYHHFPRRAGTAHRRGGGTGGGLHHRADRRRRAGR
ncbi:TetR family transcriptional regulator [Streptomyces canus]|uniref:TetR family transcriptional regulator n=1 Tax=Streptomyces canus TaxID=58343 RepID=UPI0033B711BD